MEKHVAIYARTSTSMQSNGLESQVLALKTYCDIYDLGPYVLYADEGISGTKANRPQLDKLMAAVKAGDVSSVVVYSFSRYARSVTHLLEGLQIFDAHGVSFVSISEKPRHQNVHRQVRVHHLSGALSYGA